MGTGHGRYGQYYRLKEGAFGLLLLERGKMELNKIYNIDCTEGIKKIPDKSIDCICADPPYFLGMTHNGQKGDFNDLAICKPFFTELAREFKRVLKDTGTFYIFTDWRGYAFYYPIFAGILPIRNLIVWDKISAPGNFYSYGHELIIFGAVGGFNKGGQPIWRMPSFASGAKKTNGEKVHPTQKPVELIKKIITDGCPEGGTVLDPFMGSGTTAVAAKEINRKFIGFEINEKYFNIAQSRI